jgi:hypothetical protein
LDWGFDHYVEYILYLLARTAPQKGGSHMNIHRLFSFANCIVIVIHSFFGISASQQEDLMARKILRTFGLVSAATLLASGTAFAFQQDKPATTPQPAQADSTSGERQIVVTATPLSRTAKALADCIARNCPPDEEIRAALAHGENQFVSGKYLDAKSTLKKTAGRTRKFKEKYPVEVSDLFRASGRVAEHLGEADSYQLNVLDMRDALKSGLSEKDARVMVAQIEVGDSRAKLGYPLEAFRIYENVEKTARAAGELRIADYANLRHGIMRYSYGETAKIADDTKKGLERIKSVAATSSANSPDIKLMADVFLARLDRKSGNQASTTAILKRFVEQGGSKRPLLISSYPIRTVDTVPDEYSKKMAILPSLGGNFKDRWIDVGFWVNANGNVEDIEILRATGSTEGWVKPVTDSIKSRIYAPLKATPEESNPAFYMVERYTYTSRYIDSQDQTGSRLITRSTTPRVERLDLTPDNYETLPSDKGEEAAKPAS